MASSNSVVSRSHLYGTCLLGLLLVLAFSGAMAEGRRRAFFVFGDSLVDNGNNNFLATTARADSPPYGVDYPTGRPTGRFSNGLNIPDIISEKLGLPVAEPYLSPLLTGDRLLAGANFASAGVGILNDTGIQFENIIRIGKQLEYFQQYQRRVSDVVGGEDEATRLVNEALVLINLGNNDFINNYYLVPFSARSRQFPLPDYVPYLISEYRKVLQKVYDLGGRRVIVTGASPIGCVPSELAMRSPTGVCDVELQRAAELYDPQLRQLIVDLNTELGGDVFIAANTFQMNLNVISNPSAYGFETAKIACCGQGPYNGVGRCTSESNLCPDRSVFAFWDGFHPTEKASRILVDQILTGSAELMTPMNLSTIMELDARTS